MAALLLVPVVWVARERQRMLEAREVALRAVVLAERNRTLAIAGGYNAALRAETGSKPRAASEFVGKSEDEPANSPARLVEMSPIESADRIEQLLRENAKLTKTIEKLQHQIESLKAMKGR